MNGLIVSDNKIRTRKYDLIINGDVVETHLSNKMANLLADEYRKEGFAVDKVEVFSVTKGVEIIGENAIKVAPDAKSVKNLSTPAATNSKIKRDRDEGHAKVIGMAARRNKEGKSVHYSSYGRDRNSSLHQMYLDNVRRNGFRVIVKETDEVWIGVQHEIAARIFNFIKSGGKMSDLDIKVFGADD